MPKRRAEGRLRARTALLAFGIPAVTAALLGTALPSLNPSWLAAIPVVGGSGAWLVREALRRGHPPATALRVLAFLLVLPAVGAGLWTRSTVLFDIGYLRELQGLADTAYLAGLVGRLSGPLLILAALPLALVQVDLSPSGAPSPGAESRLLPLLLAACGLAAWGAGVLLRYATLGMTAESWDLVVLTSTLSGWTWLLPAAIWGATGFARGWRRGGARQLADGALVLLALLPTLPPLGTLLATLPDPTPPRAEALPSAPHAGPRYAVAALPPDPDRLRAHLDERDAPAATPPTWRLSPGNPRPWVAVPRAAAVVALPAESSAGTLAPLVEILMRRSVTRLGLVGRAPEPPPGPLGPHLAWPVVGFLLDEPAVEAPSAGDIRYRIYADAGGPCVLSDEHRGEVRRFESVRALLDHLAIEPFPPADLRPEAPPAASRCLVVPDADLSGSALYALGFGLSGPAREAPCPHATGLAFPRPDRPGITAFARRARAVLAGEELPPPSAAPGGGPESRSGI